MSFSWPWALLALAVIPLIFAAWWRARRSRRRAPVRVTPIALVHPTVAPTGATVKHNPDAGYADDVIVVLTDGSNNRGVDPQTAARQAAARGVRVFTIGYGTDRPATLACSSTQFGGFSGFPG